MPKQQCKREARSSLTSAQGQCRPLFRCMHPKCKIHLAVKSSPIWQFCPSRNNQQDTYECLCLLGQLEEVQLIQRRKSVQCTKCSLESLSQFLKTLIKTRPRLNSTVNGASPYRAQFGPGLSVICGYETYLYFRPLTEACEMVFYQCHLNAH